MARVLVQRRVETLVAIVLRNVVSIHPLARVLRSLHVGHPDFLEVFLLDQRQVGVALHVRHFLVRLRSGELLCLVWIHLTRSHGTSRRLLR